MATTRTPRRTATKKGTPARKRTPRKAVPPPDRRHAVRASLRNVDLTKATTALTLVLLDEGEKMGELVVGRGSFIWKARHGKKRKRITWAEFSELMDRHPG